jgi:hypothetical protein
VTFERPGRPNVIFEGKLVRGDRRQLFAEVSSRYDSFLRGSMTIEINRDRRVTSIDMSRRDGRDRFEVRWRR